MRINREEKAKHREDIEGFWDWFVAISPLIPTTDHMEVLTSYSKIEAMPANIALDVIKDYNHSSRIDMALHFIVTCSLKDPKLFDKPKEVRALFHVWINKRLGFYKQC